MKKFKTFLFLNYLLVLAGSLFSTSLSGQMTQAPEPNSPNIVVKYFSSWGGYTLPFKPYDEISLEKALDRKSYYIGSYEEELLLVFEKVVEMETTFVDRYEYWKGRNKIKQRTMTKADGSVTVQFFNKRGKIIVED